MNLRNVFGRVCCVVIGLGVISVAHAWDYEGHRIVNQLALAALPADYPDFVRDPDHAERIAFLAGEPDRWRNVGDLPIKHFNSLDHYCDLEQITHAGLDLATLTSFRYEFVAQFAAGRAANPEKFPTVDGSKNSDRTREWPGFSPWAIAEQYGKLKSAFSYLKTFVESGGTADEIAGAKANIVYIMGVLGHYVGDLAQPLHTTVHHNGWVGPNPQGYTTWSGIHSWIDGGFIAKAGIKTEGMVSRVTPPKYISQAARTDGRDPMFVAVMDYLIAQQKFVEPLYELDKKRVFRAEVAAESVEGKSFIEERLLAGGQMLASIWLTAWKSAGPDNYLRGQLAKRKIAESSEP
jgi:hypothetical protein